MADDVEHKKDGWYAGKNGPFETKAAAESANTLGFVPQDQAHVQVEDPEAAPASDEG